MADETPAAEAPDTGPGRELTWGEGVEARLRAIEEKVGLADPETKEGKD
jgi:hypothetical protein